MGEADRLWVVGERAFADHLYSVSRRSLQRLVKSHPEHASVPEATLLLGRSQFALGEFQEALDTFRRAQSYSPPAGQPEEARFWEAETLFRLKRYAEARGAYDALLAANPASTVGSPAMYGLAWAELELKRPEPAVTTFQQFLRSWPDSPLVPSATFYLARTLVELKKPAEAASVLVPFGKRYPDHPLRGDAHYLLGWSRLAAGKTTEGVRDLREFISAHARHEMVVPARRAIAEALLRQNNKAELAREYQLLTAQSPHTPEGLYDAGVIAQHLGRAGDAEAAWRRLGAEFPRHPLVPRASVELARLMFQRSQFAEAVTLAKRASESGDRPLQAEALLVIGESQLKQKRYESALKAFHSVAAIEGVASVLRVRALAGSGLAYEELRQWEKATKLYAEVVEESPDRALREWARERLAAVRAKAKPPATPPAKPKAEKPRT